MTREETISLVWGASGSSRPTKGCVEAVRADGAVGSCIPALQFGMRPAKNLFSSLSQNRPPERYTLQRTSGGPGETGGHAMTGRGKRTPLIGVGLAAIAAAALLFLGVWTQAGRTTVGTGGPHPTPAVLVCPAPA